MARPLRNIAQGSTHHCNSSCHGKKNLLQSGWCRRYFLEAVRMCQEIYEFELIAAEIVGNHIHIIIRTLLGKEDVSRINQYIKARTAEMYNRATGSTGAFWNERFYSTVIEEADDPEQYLLWLLWYIGYNPVRKGLCRDPREGPVGFINCYLQKNFEAEVKITLHRFFLNLGDTFESCVERFLLYEEAYRKRLAVYF